jgi:hypothetical protein
MSNSVVPITGAPHLVIFRRHDDMRWPRGPVDTEPAEPLHRRRRPQGVGGRHRTPLRICKRMI